MENQVTITPKGLRWYGTGHPWIYRDDLKDALPALSGQIVQVQSASGKELGRAFYNPKSKIALRWLTRHSGEIVDRTFWAQRLQEAIRYRQRVVRESTAYRLISSEADGFPGLIVDRYGSVLVLQLLSLGMDQLLPVVLELLQEMVHPSAVIARNDSPIRTLEGLPQEKKVLCGERPHRVEVTEGKCRYLVDVWEGHKTGAFLDQRENRLRVSEIANGRVLDAFAYQGAFSLQAASSAKEVLAIEDSGWAAGILKENVSLNGMTNVKVERDNAFDRLRVLDRAQEQFDLVILDPPAFAKNRQEIQGAVRGYREINLRALRLLRTGGKLVSCSCSFQIGDELFLEIVRAAGADAKRHVRLLEIRTQAHDHPIVLTHPESKYLKCLIMEVL